MTTVPPTSTSPRHREEDEPNGLLVPKWVVLTGASFILGAIVLLIGSHYLEALQSCTRDGLLVACHPLDLTDVAPLLLIGITLTVPRWSEIGIGPLSVRRELEKTRQGQEDIRQVLDLRISVEQALADSPAVEASAGIEKRTMIEELKSVLSSLEGTHTERPLAIERQVQSLRRLAAMAERHPDALAVAELQRLRERAHALAASGPSTG